MSRQVQDYTLNTQKSIDELRIQGNNNARESREMISEAEEALRNELTNRFGTLEHLLEDVSTLRKQQEKTKLYSEIGMVAALLAFVSSLLGLII